MRLLSLLLPVLWAFHVAGVHAAQPVPLHLAPAHPVAKSVTHASHGARLADVWVDADPGCGGMFYADIDDCWALFHAWAIAGSRIAGISTVFGNVTGERAWTFGQGWMQRLSAQWPHRMMPPLYRGRDLPLETASLDATSTGAVSSTAGTSGKVPVMSDAERAIGDFLDASRPRSATLLMMGPLSNLAGALQFKPERQHKIVRIILLGGQPPDMPHWLPVNGRLRMRDYNVIKDPLAMDVLLRTGVPIDFVPVQAAFSHWLTAKAIAPHVSGQAALQWLSDSGAGWEYFWRWGFGTPGYPPFDLLASGLLLQPDRFACEAVSAKMSDFPFGWTRREGLALMPVKQGAGSPYRRCALRVGQARSLIETAIESARRGSH